MAFQEDLSVFFTDFAVTAVFGSETAQVLFDSPDEIIADGNVITAEYMITYPAGTFAALAYNSSITVDGIAYKAHSPQKIDDGKLMTARLTKV